MNKSWQGLDPQSLMQHVADRLKDGTPWRRYRCRLLTPLYGGGVTAGEIDRQMPVRATAIRGQLRFWWRLLNRRRPAFCSDGQPDSGKLFAGERALWGGLGDRKTLAASRVILRVEARALGKQALCEKDGSIYAAMIVTDSGARVQWLPDRQQYEFTLCWRTLGTAAASEVEEALRLWASFGGLGARRRRALGALEVFDEDGRPVQAQVEDITAAGCIRYLMMEEFTSYRQAAAAGLQCLADFRQKMGLARVEGGSLWPEANAVRAMTGRSRAANRAAVSTGPLRYFPRALFGLPIVFQFKPDEARGDPYPATLEIADSGDSRRDRFASPLIFGAWPKTVGLQTHYLPAVLLLPSHQILRKQALKLKTRSAARPIAAGSWWPADPVQRQQALPPALLPFADAKADVLATFLAYFGQGPHR